MDGAAGTATLNALMTEPVSESPSDPVRFLRPVAGAITDGFGWVSGRRHTGLDFPAALGTPVAAAGRGVVAFAGWNDGGYGNLIVIRHRLGFESWYAHLSSIGISPGVAVVGGTVIGAVGSTGHSTGPHLHFEVRQFGSPIDPVHRLLATVAAARSGGSSTRRGRCRPNGDVRGRRADPAVALLDRCP